MQTLFNLLYNFVVVPVGVGLFLVFDLALLLIILLYINRFMEWLADRR